MSGAEQGVTLEGAAAVGALALSILGLIFQGVGRFRGRTRIVLGLTPDYFTIPSRPRIHSAVFTVSVQNLGKTPYTVWDIGLELSMDQPEISTRKGRTALRQAERSNPANIPLDHYRSILGPELPHTIPVGGVVDWEFGNDALKNTPSGVTFRAYAERYSPNAKKRRRRRARSKDALPPLFRE